VRSFRFCLLSIVLTAACVSTRMARADSSPSSSGSNRGVPGAATFAPSAIDNLGLLGAPGDEPGSVPATVDKQSEDQPFHTQIEAPEIQGETLDLPDPSPVKQPEDSTTTELPVPPVVDLVTQAESDLVKQDAPGSSAQNPAPLIQAAHEPSEAAEPASCALLALSMVPLLRLRRR
jgi:hypothetical protein